MNPISLDKLKPQLAPTCFVAAGAVIVGDVTIEAESSIWYNTVLRGDVFNIHIGERTNIQDLCLGHVTSGTHALIIGSDVTVGHRVVLHGCTLHDRVMVGMGAVVMDGAEVGPDSMIGAGALVTPGTKIPPRSLALGTPAKVKRPLTEEEIAYLPVSAANYVALARRHQEALQLLD